MVNNNPLYYVDVLGNKGKKVNCHEVNVQLSASAYGIVGGSAAISLQGELCDCCIDGKIIKNDIWRVRAQVKGTVGIGAGGEITVGGFSLKLQAKGPQLELIDLRGVYEKKCEEEGSFSLQKRWALDLSVGFGAAKGIGVSVSGGANFYGGFNVEFEGRNYDVYATYGYIVSGSITGNLLFGNYKKTFYGGSDEKKFLQRSGSF